jgi:hypothetical protein
MTYPSVQSPSFLSADERAVEAADTASAESRERDPLPGLRPSEDDIASPVCAACWAY